MYLESEKNGTFNFFSLLIYFFMYFVDSEKLRQLFTISKCNANYACSQANLCYVDIDKQNSQFPEELPVFPHKMQFIAEIRALLNKYKVPNSGK